MIVALAMPASAASLPATVTVTVSDGYARLVFSSSDYIDATARVAGNVLIISFKRPIDISVDRVPDQAPDYIGAARRDPDGKAVRMALARNVTLNAMAAGEKFFVDLLPDSWTGVPPGLPQDVVDELARRAREADELMQRERQTAQQKQGRADSRPCRDPADFHALYLRRHRSDLGHLRSRQGSAGSEF